MQTERAVATAPTAARAYSRAADNRTWRLLALLGATLVLWVVFDRWTDGVFLTPRNLSNLAVQMTVIGLLAIGATWLLVARAMDLSVGALLALCAVVAFQLQVDRGWGAVPTVIAILVLGMLVGALQGLLTTWLRIPAFIVTLAGFSWLRGLAYIVSGSLTLSGASDGFYKIANDEIPSGPAIALMLAGAAIFVLVRVNSLRSAPGGGVRAALRPVNVVAAVATAGMVAIAIWAFGSYQGLPYPVMILAVVLGIAAYVSKHTAFGRHIYAIGGSPEAARRAGIRVQGTIFALFVISGFLAAVGGVVQASRLDAGPPNLGGFLALDAISAAVIGGTSLFGGQGTVGGAALGAMLMVTISNGLSLAGVDTFYQLVATGLLLLVAVGIDSATRKRVEA